MPYSKRKTLAYLSPLFLLLVVAVTVQAAGPGAPTRALPFQGVLEVDGQPPSGVYSMTFGLFDDATAGAELFTESQTVNVAAGAFSAVIGSTATLPDSVFTAAELFVAVEVEGQALGNRQQIFAGHRSVDPPGLFTAGTLRATVVEATTLQAGTLQTGHITSDTDVQGLAGWRIAADLQGPHGALRLDDGTLQLGLHSDGNVYVSDYSSGNLEHRFVLRSNGVLDAAGLKLSNTSRIKRIQSGTAGACDGNSSIPTAGSVTFPVAFDTAPVVVVTPGEFDDAGCTQVRLRGVSTTGFMTRSYATNAVASCDCIHWMAIEQ